MNSFQAFYDSIEKYLGEGIGLLSKKYSWFSDSTIEINDLRQEALIKLFIFWKNGGTISKSKSVKYFIFHILENTAINLIRKRRKIPPPEYMDPILITGGKKVDIFIFNPRIQEIVEVKEILEKLPETERKFLELLCQKSDQEIMEIYGITYKSFHNKVCLINRKLKILLEVYP